MKQVSSARLISQEEQRVTGPGQEITKLEPERGLTGFKPKEPHFKIRIVFPMM